MSAPEVRAYDDPTALARGAAQEILALVARAVAREGRFLLALAGGNTPRELYRLLASEPFRSALDWSKVEVLWGDERCVPPDDAHSNYALAHELLLSRVPVREGAVHRIRGELPPEEAARRYTRELEEVSGATTPRFDLVLLGMGTDGHVASLFPDTPHLATETRPVVVTRSPRPPHDRVSLSLRAINAARAVMMLVAGTAKAEMLARVLAARPADEEVSPAALVRPERGRLLRMVDRAAADRLQR